MKVFHDFDELASAVGSTFGPGPWHVIDQDRIDAFADATGDHQWIHVDPDRAATVFGGTIAHGYLVLSLIPLLASEIMSVTGTGMGINYGLDRVRFITPVPADGRIRATITPLDVHNVSDGTQVKNRVTIELADSAKPACVAETMSRYYRKTPGAGDDHPG